MSMDWPTRGIVQGLMEFGAIAAGTLKTFVPTIDSPNPYYPSLLLLTVPQTGDTAIVAILAGPAQPKIRWTTHPVRVTNIPDNPDTVNIYKVGIDLVFQFNRDVPAFNALRIM